MILITGGAFQGALECAVDMIGTRDEIRIADGNVDEIAEVNGCQIWDHMTHWMRRSMENGMTSEAIACAVDELVERNPQLIIITQELGCGLVPVDRFDRMYREAHGRLCCHLAGKASGVYRVSCGLAQCIKKEESVC